MSLETMSQQKNLENGNSGQQTIFDNWQDLLNYCLRTLKRKFDIDFKLDKDNREVIEALCLYHTKNPAFCELNSKWSLDKGILLFGHVGVGKTTIMKLFSDTPVGYMKFHSCRIISDDYQKNGFEAIDQFSKNESVCGGRSYFEHRLSSVCFDDLGTESISKYYGDPKNTMAEIILNRYDFRLPFHTTNITTNFSSDQIEEHYGLRVKDRLVEMCNLLVLKGTSRRK